MGKKRIIKKGAEYEEKKEPPDGYDCSNGERCFNDFFRSPVTGCAWKELFHTEADYVNSPYLGKSYHCEPDLMNCGGRGTGYDPSVTSCLPGTIREEFDCFGGNKWYNYYERSPATNCQTSSTPTRF